MPETIILTPSVSVLETRAYLATQQFYNVVKNPLVEGVPCIFPLFNCDTPIPQFINLLSPSDTYENDFYSFILSLPDGYTIEAELELCASGDVYAITDDTYGTLTDLGESAVRPDIWSFRVDWHKIHTAFGFGRYSFNFTIKNGVRVISEQTSPCFRLKPWDCDDAHGTVRIQTNQTGYIQNGFDYQGVNTTIPKGLFNIVSEGWQQQIRWYGSFAMDIPLEESDYVQDSARIERQIQEKITDQFKLKLRLLRSDFGDHIMRDMFLADEILISDYNLNNYRTFKNQAVRKVSTDELLPEKMQRGLSGIWTFKDVDEGTIKRIHG